jgi:hypothetical protein
MAKLKGPLLSETARGSFGPRLTFSRRPSGQQARYQRAQKDYENEARAAQRIKFFIAKNWWKQMTATEQAGFDGYTKEAQ